MIIGRRNSSDYKATVTYFKFIHTKDIGCQLALPIHPTQWYDIDPIFESCQFHDIEMLVRMFDHW